MKKLILDDCLSAEKKRPLKAEGKMPGKIYGLSKILQGTVKRA